jgi:hypothetical protein
MGTQVEQNTDAADQVDPVVGQSGVDLIAAERRRQIEQEGWTPEHDDEHTAGEMAAAAALYAAPKDDLWRVEFCDSCHAPHVTDPWPWWDNNYSGRGPRLLRAWDKRGQHSRLRRLVIAGALIAAEIERLQRAG